MANFLGIDLGTSSVKVIVVNEKGDILGQASRSYSLSFPKPGWSEQNPSDWVKATKESIKEVLSSLNIKEIKGLSFSGQMHGLVILDENDNVIRPVILWNDGRTTSEVEYLNNIIGKDKLIEYTGNIAFAGFTAPKILWLKNNEIDSFNKIKKIMLPKDYLAYLFTGNFVSDYSDASGTLLLDVKNKKWSKEMLDICGISLSQLPELHDSYEVVGELKDDIKNELGIVGSTKVIIGGGDNEVAAIGTGCYKDGDCNISLGTSGSMFYVCDQFHSDKDIVIHSFNHTTGKYHLMSCILSAASCNQWWIENIIKQPYKNAAEKLNEYVGKSNVLFAPYLMGERCPYNDPTLTGGFFNLSLNTKQEEMTLAILEGVAFDLRNCAEEVKKMGLSISKTTICGGGCKTKIWPEIISNILNIPVSFVETEQGPGYGACILAMVGTKQYNSIDEACSILVNIKDTIYPNKELVEFYNNKYLKYRKLYKAIKSLD